MSESEQWTCDYCGREEHDTLEVCNGGIEVDVTCESVYLSFNDGSGDPGMAFSHETFEDIMEFYRTVDADA